MQHIVSDYPLIVSMHLYLRNIQSMKFQSSSIRKSEQILMFCYTYPTLPKLIIAVLSDVDIMCNHCVWCSVRTTVSPERRQGSGGDARDWMTAVPPMCQTLQRVHQVYSSKNPFATSNQTAPGSLLARECTRPLESKAMVPPGKKSNGQSV